MRRKFEDLVAEADAAPMEGWDFSWLDGRATEERPPWGYQRLLSERLPRVSAAMTRPSGTCQLGVRSRLCAYGTTSSRPSGTAHSSSSPS
jgi:hypothetical protein